VVWYECEAWFQTLREEHRLRVFEKRVLRSRFEPKGGEVRGGWRKLHNEELHDLYSLPSISRIIKSRSMRWAGHVARMGRRRRRKRRRRRMHIGFWKERQKERDNCENIDAGERIILKWNLER
jgi:hypothetical protein